MKPSRNDHQTAPRKGSLARPPPRPWATSSTKAAGSTPCFDKAQERYGELQGGYTRIIRTVPRRGDNCRDGHHRAGLSALRQDLPSPPIRGFSILRLAAPTAQVIVQPPLKLALSPLDPLRHGACVAAVAPISGVHGAGQVFISGTPAAASPPALAKHSMVRLRPNAFGPRRRRGASIGMLVTRATYRRYAYTLYKRPHAQSFPGALQAWHRYRFRLNRRAMPKALEGLLGHHLTSPRSQSRAAAAAFPHHASRRWLWSGAG